MKLSLPQNVGNLFYDRIVRFFVLSCDLVENSIAISIVESPIQTSCLIEDQFLPIVLKLNNRAIIEN